MITFTDKETSMKIISIQAPQTKLALKPLLKVYLVTLEPQKNWKSISGNHTSYMPSPQYIGQAAIKAH